MNEKELAKYVLTHNLNEVIEICKKIINTEEKSGNKIIELDLNKKDRLMALNIQDSKLSNRAKTVLIKNNINTIEELLKIPIYKLLKIPYLGWSTFNDIKFALHKYYGLELKEY